MESHGIGFDLTSQQDERALELVKNSIFVDMLMSTNPTRPTPIIDGTNAQDRAISAGLNAANITLAGSRTTFRGAIEEINNVYRLLATSPEKTVLVQGTSDIQRAKEEGKLGLIMGFQNATPLEDDWINTLPVVYKMGVRIIQLTYNDRNLLGSGCTEPIDDGLTAYGRQVVGALNSTGIIIDLSHVGHKTVTDAIALSRTPVIVSHANAATLNPHPRNLPDDVIKALADRGGVMGIVAFSVACTTDPNRGPTLSDYLDHLDYVVKLVGVDHVGIGSDINENFKAMPIGSEFETQYSYMFEEANKKYIPKHDRVPGTRLRPAVEHLWWIHQLPNITRGLVARGYSDGDIQKILGGNFLRVAQEVWHGN